MTDRIRVSMSSVPQDNWDRIFGKKEEKPNFMSLDSQGYTWAEHSKLCMRTVRPELTHEMRLGNFAVGLAAEALELLEAALMGHDQDKVQKELGDVFWYLGAFTHEAGMDLVLPSSVHLIDQSALLSFVFSIGKIADYIKKVVYHGHPEEWFRIRDEVKLSLSLGVLISDEFKTDLVTVLKANIDKLRKRFPEGFSTERSINRSQE